MKLYRVFERGGGKGIQCRLLEYFSPFIFGAVIRNSTCNSHQLCTCTDVSSTCDGSQETDKLWGDTKMGSEKCSEVFWEESKTNNVKSTMSEVFKYFKKRTHWGSGGTTNYSSSIKHEKQHQQQGHNDRGEQQSSITRKVGWF